jgi:hypothetical protein
VTNESSPKHFPLLIGTCIFAWLWTVARACVQSVTIDEADTYLSYAGPAGPTHWSASANNHVLNSLLMRLVTSIFGASAITLRVPALIGAALYIGAVYYLVRLISQRRILQWALAVCLMCSPFVMDYLVAARGYGLASAFLLWMVAIAGRYQAQEPAVRAACLRRTCLLISLCGALCVCANFSFALADALTALGLFLWMCREHRRDYLKILAAFTLPGLVVGYFFVGSVVLSWPRGQFTWGSDSLLKTLRSLVSASLFEPNDYLLNPRLLHYFVHFGPFLYPILTAFVVWRVVMLILGRMAVEDVGARRSTAVAAICGAALLAALACHEFLYVAYQILLPFDRTAMWVVLLFLAMAGGLAAVPLPSAGGRASGQALTAILVLIACYNIGCLRLTYFNEWKYDAAMKDVYSVLSYYNHTYGLTKVSTNWRYVAAINCYRTMSGHETIEPIPGAPTVVNYYPPGYQAYVFYYSWDADFYKREGLTLVYRDRFSDAAVAVRPEVLSHSQAR